MQLFVAVEIPDEVKQKLSLVRQATERKLKQARFAREEGMHLTLQFLGQVKEAKVEEIKKVLTEAVNQFKIFTFKLSDLGGFPSVKKGRVLWLGVEDGQDNLIVLQKVVARSLTSIGFEEEKRKFHPHLTLARLKIPQGLQEAISSVCLEDFTAVAITVDKVTLFQSVLKSSGAVYNSLSHFYLKGS